jgi:hypothetical protein
MNCLPWQSEMVLSREFPTNLEKIEMSLATSTPTKQENAARPGVHPAHA